MSPQTIAVLRVLLADPTEPRYGLDIARVSGLKTGTLHPILRRLEQEGLVESFWEDTSTPEAEGRPRRRYYRFAGHGSIAAAHQAVARADAAAAAAGGVPVLRPQTGL